MITDRQTYIVNYRVACTRLKTQMMARRVGIWHKWWVGIWRWTTYFVFTKMFLSRYLVSKRKEDNLDHIWLMRVKNDCKTFQIRLLSAFYIYLLCTWIHVLYKYMLSSCSCSMYFSHSYLHPEPGKCTLD